MFFIARVISFQKLLSIIATKLRQAKIYRMKLRMLPWLMLGTVAAIAAIGLANLAPLQSQVVSRWLEIEQLTGTVMVQTSAERPAQVGDRLSKPGDALSTQQRSSAYLALDTDIGSVAVAQNTDLRVQRLDVLPDGARVTVLEIDRGQARIQARPFTNPNTILELHTPSGVAAVRGTDFGVIVNARGKTSIGTLEGRVEATAESITVMVDEGLASIIRPGEPPTTPSRLDRDLDIDWLTQVRRRNRFTLTGRIEPTNTLFYGGQEILISANGYFEWTGTIGLSNRSFSFVVQNPLGESRTHRINSWQLPDVARP